jgi:hypothetical protein
MEISGFKKSIILWILILGAGFPLFAQSSPKTYIFFQPITGAGSSPEDKEHITTMLNNEIRARNCALLESPYGTDFILYGMLGPYYEGYEDWYLKGTTPGAASYSYNALLQTTANRLYVFQLMLRDTKTNETLVQQTLYYTSMDELYNFFPLLVYNLFTHILGAPAYTTAQAAPSKASDRSDDTWRNKWFYLRTSFDFPINYYSLKEDDLIAGVGVYEGLFDHPNRIAPLDNMVVALPAMTVGFELQFLNWLSIEPKFQVGMDHMNDTDFFYFEAGFELKVPLKFMRSIMLEPYGAVSIPIMTPTDLFKTTSLFGDSVPWFPWFGVGGGVQISAYGGKAGAVFVDISYMYFGDVGRLNPFGELYPSPEIIHYNRSVIGIGIGYKAGFGNRKVKEKSKK